MTENLFNFTEHELKTIEAVRKFLKNKKEPFSELPYLRLIRKLNEIWNTSVSLSIEFFAVHKSILTGGGFYSAEEKVIYLYLPSIFILLHEFKHHLQKTYPQYTKIPNSEIDAYCWSITIVRTANPEYYNKIENEKKLFFTRSLNELLKNINTTTLKHNSFEIQEENHIIKEMKELLQQNYPLDIFQNQNTTNLSFHKLPDTVTTTFHNNKSFHNSKRNKKFKK